MENQTHYQLSIRNTLGLRSFLCRELGNPGETTQILGTNATGKTSLATALGAAAALDPNPRSLPANRCGLYQHDHTGKTDTAEVQLSFLRKGERFVNSWVPGGKVAGQKPVSDAGAVGLIDWIQPREKKARLAIFQKYVMPKDVSKLVREILPASYEEAEIRGIIDQVKTEGWASVEKTFAEHARYSKRRWAEIVGGGLIYGKTRAANWRPEGWKAELEGLTEETVAQEWQKAKAACDATLWQETISEETINKGREAMEKVPAVDAKICAAKEQAELASEEADKISQSMREAEELWTQANSNLKRHSIREPKPKKHTAPDFFCPLCDGALNLVGKSLVAGESPHHFDDESKHDFEKRFEPWSLERDTLSDNLETITQQIKKIRSEKIQVVAALDTSRSQMGYLTAERDRLHEASKAADLQASTGNDNEVEEAELLRDDLSADLVNVRALKKALKVHENAMTFSELAHAFGPDGIRKGLSAGFIAQMTTLLDAMTESAGWKKVAVDIGFNFSLGGRPVQLASASERWIVNALVTLAITLITRSTLTILDGIDILDKDKLSGLSAILERMNKNIPTVCVLICGTMMMTETSPIKATRTLYLDDSASEETKLVAQNSSGT